MDLMQGDLIQDIQLSRKEQKEVVRDYLLLDIDLVLSPYRNKDIGLRILAEKTGISEKTYRRIIEKVTVPHLSTTERFYQYFFEIVKDEQIELRHREIKKIVCQQATLSEAHCDRQLESILEDNKVLREIFLYSRTGVITRQFVKDEFGKYGIEMLDLLLNHSVLIEAEKGVYIAGNISISKTNKSIKKIVTELISDNLDADKLSELGHNKAFYAIEGVDAESKQKLLQLMDEYQEKLMNFLLKQAKPGDNRMFVAAAADQLKRTIKFDKNDNVLLQ